MSATGNYCLGRGNVLLAGEAAGLNRGAEGITSALISGNAAGESILESMQSGKKAMATYPKALEDEMTHIQNVNQMLEGALGYNFFTRE